jgi:NAD-dependent deacetylase
MLTDGRRVVSFSGAGLSAESGVGTFRDAQDGLWAKYDPARLASPEGFAADPELVIDWYAARRRIIGDAQPNPAHIALAGRGHIVHVTQNVDDLLHRAGAEQVIALHGSIGFDRCHGGCGHMQPVDMTDPPGLRDCPACGSPLRPAVVWFGEAMPPEAWDVAERACRGCDVLLVIGTSAVVYPAAGLIGVAKSAGAEIIVVNTEPSEASPLADIELLGQAGRIVPQLLA